MGENLFLEAGRSACGFRENTVRSFAQAAASGASFIEFDVQVTRDGVPVIWHDDFVLTGSQEDPLIRKIGDLSLAEFKNLTREPSALLRRFKGQDGLRVGVKPWSEMPEEDELPTLAEVFARMPHSVGFDIEVKMTTPDDVHITPAEEVDRVVRPLLELVQQCAPDNARTIVFTSFDPEVCIALRERQARFPVLFLSGGGAYEHVDARRTSIPRAIEFAASAGLQGIVLETAMLRKQEMEISAARSRGLQLYTYGQQNSDADWLRRQFFLGVQGAIVDDIPAVVAALSLSSITM